MILTLALSISALWSNPVPVSAPDATPNLTVSHLRHGQVAIFKMTGVSPGRTCGLIVSLSGAGPITIQTGPCPVLSLSLTQPLYFLGTDNSDGTGTAVWTKPIPSNAGGRTIWAQGVSFYNCETSNLLSQVVS